MMLHLLPLILNKRRTLALSSHDKLDISNCSFYPRDSILTHNPIPYSFDSEQDWKRYFDLIKKETIDSLFEKVLAEFNNFVNAEEHSLTVLAADTLYSYFQDIFSTTHYNIFVGENGSGKNSALLVYRILGYRVFYITAASAPNYYTFLGDIQEGQGTIAEDEADNIGKSSDKKIILKTGYASGGCVPKGGFFKQRTPGFSSHTLRFATSGWPWRSFRMTRTTGEHLTDRLSINSWQVR